MLPARERFLGWLATEARVCGPLASDGRGKEAPTVDHKGWELSDLQIVFVAVTFGAGSRRVGRQPRRPRTMDERHFVS